MFHRPIIIILMSRHSHTVYSIIGLCICLLTCNCSDCSSLVVMMTDVNYNNIRHELQVIYSFR